jgi:hypothetical protein
MQFPGIPTTRRPADRKNSFLCYFILFHTVQHQGRTLGVRCFDKRLHHIRGTILAIIDTDNNNTINSKMIFALAFWAGAADASGPTANYSECLIAEIVSVTEG